MDSCNKLLAKVPLHNYEKTSLNIQTHQILQNLSARLSRFRFNYFHSASNIVYSLQLLHLFLLLNCLLTSSLSMGCGCMLLLLRSAFKTQLRHIIQSLFSNANDFTNIVGIVDFSPHGEREGLVNAIGNKAGTVVYFENFSGEGLRAIKERTLVAILTRNTLRASASRPNVQFT